MFEYNQALFIAHAGKVLEIALEKHGIAFLLPVEKLFKETLLEIGKEYHELEKQEEVF